MADVSYLTSVNEPSQVYHFSYVSATDTLTLLIKVPATVTFLEDTVEPSVARDYLPEGL